MIAKTKGKTSDLEVEVTDHEAIITRDDRRYRVRSLKKNTCYDQLKINLMASPLLERNCLMLASLESLWVANRTQILRNPTPVLISCTAANDGRNQVRRLHHLDDRHASQHLVLPA